MYHTTHRDSFALKEKMGVFIQMSDISKPLEHILF